MTSTMSERVFFDTNVLVYSLDAHEPDQQGTARAVLTEHATGGTGVLSTQVLQEFYVTATRKLGVEALVAKSMVTSLENFDVVTVTPALIRDAIDCSVLSQLSFWDSLIVVAAAAARCDVLMTEGLNHGQVIRGVRVHNPFA